MTNANVLLISNEHLFNDLLQRAFASTGWKILTVTGAKEAQDMMYMHRPDLVIVNINDQTERTVEALRPSLSSTKLLVFNRIGSAEAPAVID